MEYLTGLMLNNSRGHQRNTVPTLTPVSGGHQRADSSALSHGLLALDREQSANAPDFASSAKMVT